VSLLHRRAGSRPLREVLHVNIVVCVKQVPDSWAEKKLDPSDKTEDRASVDAVMNELDEYGVEEALRLKEAHGGEVTVVTMGPEKATETVRKALSMGADKAVLLTDESLHGSDAVQTATALAKVISGLEYDLVIVGSESTDARMSIMGSLLAEALGLPQLTQARKVTVDGSTVSIERQTDTGYDVVEAQTPAVVGVVEKINEPRYPSFKGIMAAKKKPLTTMTVADAGLDAGTVGLANSFTGVSEFTNRPPRSAGQIVKDEGDGGVKIAEFLAAQKIV
jgi:electron transfer flavoprotein beta subunit